MKTKKIKKVDDSKFRAEFNRYLIESGYSRSNVDEFFKVNENGIKHRISLHGYIPSSCIAIFSSFESNSELVQTDFINEFGSKFDTGNCGQFEKYNTWNSSYENAVKELVLCVACAKRFTMNDFTKK